AAGWLGRRLVHALTGVTDDLSLRELWRPRPVRCLVLPGQSTPLEPTVRGRVSVLEGDITNPSDYARLFEGALGCTLFHTAGVIHPKRVRQYYEVNLVGTRRLLEAAASEGVRRVVVTSSNSPCGNGSSPTQLLDESSEYSAHMGYGRSKMEM